MDPDALAAARGAQQNGLEQLSTGWLGFQYTGGCVHCQGEQAQIGYRGLLALAGSEVGSVRAMCVGERSSEARARVTVMPLSPQNAHFPIYNYERPFLTLAL